VKLKEKDMKRLMGLVAALSLLTASSVASAAEEAWFTLEGTTCTGVSSTGGGPNQTLAITKDNTATCNVTVGYNLTSEAFNLQSYALQLFNTPDVSLVSVDFTPGDALGFVTHFSNNTLGSFVDIGGLNAAPAGTDMPPAGALVARITMQISKPNAGAHSILGDYGSSAQAHNNGYLWFGGVGANGNTYGQANYTGQEVTGWGALPVITITNVPEPATLALLGVGALALIRRRR
jgi:hypothetical protein